jgi:hypothetical protein
MALATLQRQVARMREALGRMSQAADPRLTRLRADPTRILTDAGLTPDPWQAGLLQSPSPAVLLNCSRQSGKSTVAAALALQAALLTPRSLVLLLSPSQRQSAELLVKVLDIYRALGRPVPTVRPKDNALKLELANGSRIISLPGTEGTIRGYSSARLLMIDEAARVSDDLYRTVRPMLAVSRGRLVCLSTPFGRQGWFYTAWTGADPWRRVKVVAGQCRRIPPAFLAEERRAIGERWFNQEYGCEFMDMVGAVFSGADIDAAVALPVARLEFPA